MTDETSTETTPAEDTAAEQAPEAAAESDHVADADNMAGDAPSDEADTFPREVVERLRQENGKYRQRAQRADTYAQRLHGELVKATGRLADPTDLEFDEEHLDDAEKLAAAIDELLTRKPHLASRRPTGDIGQGQRGSSSEPFSLLNLLKQHT